MKNKNSIKQIAFRRILNQERSTTKCGINNNIISRIGVSRCMPILLYVRKGRACGYVNLLWNDKKEKFSH